MSDPLNVLVVSALFPRETNPMQGIFIHRQIKAVRDLGVDVSVLCPLSVSRPSHLLRRFRARDEWDGVPVRYLASWHVPIVLSPALQGSLLLKALRQALRREPHRPDLYHAHWLFPTAWATVRAAAGSGVPVVASARGSDVHTHPVRSRRLRRLTQEAMADATLVTAVSQSLAHQARILGPPGIEVEAIHNGVDDRLFYPASDQRRLRREMALSEDGFYWVSVCRLVSEKGTGELLVAFAALAKNSTRARLLLVGDGPEAVSLRRMFRDQGLGERVVFAGRCHPEKVARWLQAADAFVLASHAEGLPNVVLEAMASGLPVVATDVGGTREAVVDGASGFLVPPRDAGSLAGAIMRISEEPGLAAKFGIEGRKRVERYFGWSASARHWIDVYERALRMSRSRPAKPSMENPVSQPGA